MDKILIFGSSGHAKVITEIVELSNNFAIAGYLDSFKPKGSIIHNYEVLGKIDEIEKIAFDYGIRGGIVAVGDNYSRSVIVENILNILPDFNFVTAVHPRSNLSNSVQIGQGTVIAAGSTISVDARIGEHCILNTNSALDHDSVMENFSSLAPGVSVGGKSLIGFCSAICIGATIINDITIGRHSVIGAGSVVVKNISDYQTAYGIPAKIVRSRKIDDKYL